MRRPSERTGGGRRYLNGMTKRDASGRGGFTLIEILAVVMILTVYSRFFKLYMATAIAPIPLSSFAGQPSSSIGVAFLKAYASICLVNHITLPNFCFSPLGVINSFAEVNPTHILLSFNRGKNSLYLTAFRFPIIKNCLLYSKKPLRKIYLCSKIDFSVRVKSFTVYFYKIKYLS